jgi:hypothetical protein
VSSHSFTEANRFWFDEGRTARALRRYADAARERPKDPAVLLQYGLSLWGVDRFGEAKDELLKARQQQHMLTERGRLTLEAWLPQFIEDPAPRHYPEFAPDQLDRDRLVQRGPEADWRAVADAAAERRMFGVVRFALERWGGVPIDAQDARELDEINAERAAQLSAVRTVQLSFTEARRRNR